MGGSAGEVPGEPDGTGEAGDASDDGSRPRPSAGAGRVGGVGGAEIIVSGCVGTHSNPPRIVLLYGVVPATSDDALGIDHTTYTVILPVKKAKSQQKISKALALPSATHARYNTRMLITSQI